MTTELIEELAKIIDPYAFERHGIVNAPEMQSFFARRIDARVKAHKCLTAVLYWIKRVEITREDDPHTMSLRATTLTIGFINALEAEMEKQDG